MTCSDEIVPKGLVMLTTESSRQNVEGATQLLLTLLATHKTEE